MVPVDAAAVAVAARFFTKRFAKAPSFLFAGMTQQDGEQGTEDSKECFRDRHVF